MTNLPRSLAMLALPLALSACGDTPETFFPEYGEVVARTERAYAFAQQETPFENGPMNVLATEDGQLRSYTLVPCRGGAAICAGGLHGAAGTLNVTPDYHVVQGLHGRTFWLSPGGDGWIGYRNGTHVPLAWDSIDRPVGPWETARMTEGPARD